MVVWGAARCCNPTGMDDLTVGSNRYWGLLGRAALMGGVVGGFGLLFFGIVNLGTSTIWPDMGERWI